jgi:hypothetical protein
MYVRASAESLQYCTTWRSWSAPNHRLKLSVCVNFNYWAIGSNSRSLKRDGIREYPGPKRDTVSSLDCFPSRSHAPFRFSWEYGNCRVKNGNGVGAGKDFPVPFSPLTVQQSFSEHGTRTTFRGQKHWQVPHSAKRGYLITRVGKTISWLVAGL